MWLTIWGLGRERHTPGDTKGEVMWVAATECLCILHSIKKKNTLDQKSPTFYRKNPVFHHKKPCCQNSSVLHRHSAHQHSLCVYPHCIKRALHSIKRALPSIKRALHSIKRALNFNTHSPAIRTSLRCIDTAHINTVREYIHM